MTERKTRTQAQRPKTWKEPNDLDVPQELQDFLSAEGFGTRWVRIAIHNASDSENILRRSREGYEFVTTSEAEAHGWSYPPSYDTGKESIVRVGDLALAKLPLEVSQDRDRQMAERADAIMRGVHAQLTANAKENQLTPLFNSSSESVNTGGSRPVHVDRK
jgi:hypothetical protein